MEGITPLRDRREGEQRPGIPKEPGNVPSYPNTNCRNIKFFKIMLCVVCICMCVVFRCTSLRFVVKLYGIVSPTLPGSVFCVLFHLSVLNSPDPLSSDFPMAAFERALPAILLNVDLWAIEVTPVASSLKF